jgi:adenosylcobinamide hydrolase
MTDPSDAGRDDAGGVDSAVAGGGDTANPHDPGPFDTTIRGIAVTVDSAAVRVTSRRPLRVLSSALVGGGFGETREIVNMHVDDVAPDSSPERELRDFAARLGIDEPFVGLMTAAATEHARLAVAADGELTVAAVASVGLSNTVCAGVTTPAPAPPAQAGTINAILLFDADLTPAAMVNAVITATEAKTMALGEWQVQDPGGAPASGTSTDAVVVACTGRGEALDYAGPGTMIGFLAARAVRAAIARICREKLARDGGRRGW